MDGRLDRASREHRAPLGVGSLMIFMGILVGATSWVLADSYLSTGYLIIPAVALMGLGFTIITFGMQQAVALPLGGHDPDGRAPRTIPRSVMPYPTRGAQDFVHDNMAWNNVNRWRTKVARLQYRHR